MASTLKKKRGDSWTEEGMRAAIEGVQERRLTQRAACAKFNIPRRTLREHLRRGSISKRLGRKPILTESQESELAERIKRFATFGILVTPMFIRKQAFLFCERYCIPNNFSESKRIAGFDWLRTFLERNPSINKFNPARAKNLVKEHFQALKKLYNELDIPEHPERLYSMDEKSCRITVHNQLAVLEELESKKVNLIAPELAENVAITMCISANGTAIPPMILFKGPRPRNDLEENLPPETLVRIAPKGNMTSDLYLEFIQHLGKYKVAGKCLLILDGAKFHLTCEAFDEADKYGIVLYCLPSTATHELQPLNISVSESYEQHWDAAVMDFLYAKPHITLSKFTFNEIFSKVWPKFMTHNNIVDGFRATGLFPFNPKVISSEQTHEQPMQDSESDDSTGNPLISSETPSTSILEHITQDSGSDSSTTGTSSVLSETPCPQTREQPVMQDSRSDDETSDFQDFSLVFEEIRREKSSGSLEGVNNSAILPKEEPEIKREIEDDITIHEEDIEEKLENRKRKHEVDPLADIFKRIKTESPDLEGSEHDVTQQTSNSNSEMQNRELIALVDTPQPKPKEVLTVEINREKDIFPVDFMRSVLSSQNEILTVLKNQVLLQDPDPDLLTFLRLIGAKLSRYNTKKRKEMQNAIIDFINKNDFN